MSSRNRTLYGVIIFVILIFTGSFIWYSINLGPVATDGVVKQLEIKLGDRAPQIATQLKNDGLIRDRNTFITYLNLHGLRSQLKAGVYSLKPSYSVEKIVDLLTSGKVDVNRIVIPEGSTISAIEKLAQSHGIDRSAFSAALAAHHSQTFLQSKPESVSLEGYLFPDSYEITSGVSATKLINTMLDTFGQRVGTEYVRAFSAEGLTLHQALTIASIVEKEVSRPADRPIVAQVFLKRFKSGMPLGSDVTINYASSITGLPFSTSLNSPYNTYLHPGLPPGPICNPGQSSLDSVARPATTDYLYFLAAKDGKTYYAKTYAEHQQNIAKYLN